MADSDGTLVRMDPTTEAQVQAETGLSIGRLTATDDGIWAADVLTGELTHVDAESLRKTGAPIPIAANVDQIVGSGDDVWVLDKVAGTVTRVDTVTRKVGSPIRVGRSPQDMAVGLGAVWVADLDGSLSRVDVVTLEVRTYQIGPEVLGVDIDDDAEAVWVYVGDPIPACCRIGPQVR